MKCKEVRLRQIEAIARSEPLGSRAFLIQFGCLGAGAAASVALFGIWLFLWMYIVYLAIFVAEKKIANYAIIERADELLGACLSLLALRALTYDTIAVALWTFEDSVFRMGTLALVAASTLNLLINQVAFVATMACVAIPNLLVFFVISGLIYQESGFSSDFLGSIIIIVCVLPYFAMSLLKARGRWEQQEQTKLELERSQRLESMGKVASGVSHDFNNILSVVSGSLQLLEKSSDEAERRNLLRIARRAIEHGSGLTKQMLALGRRSPLVPKATDLNQSVVDFQGFITRILPANIIVETRVSRENPIAIVDPGMLQNAMLNLALNSKAAMPEGGRLLLSTASVSVPKDFPITHALDGNCAVLSIADTGNGIDAADLPHVFEPFFTTKGVGQGSGLGLSMVRGFAEQSNGTVEIKSEVGFGTELSIFLPLTDRVSKPIAEPPQAAREEPRDGDKGRVLVVEDNPQLLSLIALKLERDGFEVIRKPTGDEAMDVLTDDSGIQLVVTDLVMPGTNQGIDVLDKAKSLAGPLPVILMSGYADIRKTSDEDLRRADRFIEKPLSLDGLASNIADLIAESRHWRA